MDGGDGNDDLWGGKGNDTLNGGEGDDVLRGEDGDDYLFAGSGISGAGMPSATEYVYGGAGNDAIFGQTTTTNAYLLGGAGDDYILSGYGGATSKIWGNDGDDYIRQEDQTAEATVHAGKGDDTVNRLFWNEETKKFQLGYQYSEDSDGYGNFGRTDGSDMFNVDSYGAEGIPIELIEGNQGDDEIWGSAKTTTTQTLKGGSGDDSVYAGYENAGKVYVYGNSGEDIVRSDWFQQFDETKVNKETEQYLFGDYKYGDDALDKDLWGDDDLIYGGDAEMSGKAWRYGGDGADSIWTGKNWAEMRSYGGNGADRFHIGQQNILLYTYGEDGDDEWFVEAYGDVDADPTGTEFGFGGAGNDVVRGTHQPTGNQLLYGGDDEDKIYGGDFVGGKNYLTGGDGDDWIEGGDNAVDTQYIYGDSGYAGSFTTFPGTDYGRDNDLYKVDDRGNDVVYGGDSAAAGQYLVGGYGDDKIIAGDKEGSLGQYVWGDIQYFAPNTFPSDHPNADKATEYGLKYLGLPGDGDDLIDMGDHPDHAMGMAGNYAYGQGGNDKIIGGITSQQSLYGGNGDDKIWALNPGQTYDPARTNGVKNTLQGGDDDDILYGSAAKDYLYGDFSWSPADPDFEWLGGDDIIYTGNAEAATDGSMPNGSFAFGGVGDDKIYGQGEGDDYLFGDDGDDLISGGKGADTLWGDDADIMTIAAGVPTYTLENAWDAAEMRYKEYGLESGDDTIYGGEGKDIVHAGAGDDYVYGDEGVDTLYGSAGEDTIWGGDGGDLLFTGTGWDTVFGGPGCDYIYSQDGGDVIWGGDCDPAQDEKDKLDADTAHLFQQFFVRGTGAPENYTVIMDFWHETAMPYNVLCLYPSVKQDIPGAGVCSETNKNFTLPFVVGDISANASCLTAVDIMSGRTPEGVTGRPAQNTRNSGCKNDGGPLWVTVELVDSADDITNMLGGGDEQRTVWGKIFQKKQAKTTSRRSRRSSRYA